MAYHSTAKTEIHKFMLLSFMWNFLGNVKIYYENNNTKNYLPGWKKMLRAEHIKNYSVLQGTDGGMSESGSLNSWTMPTVCFFF